MSPTHDMSDPIPDEKSSGEKAHAALIARLARLYRKPTGVRPPQSLQPTPEAAKSRVTRLRQKQRLLQKSKRPPALQPPARDPLSP